ncbi:hypothetical protein ACH5RR_022828 [Cinchona calisaya]|uniref:Transmembrane protein n=1 Tax=Cinchona calisaya TaxID=153742 RepID=A0ABD2Z8W2_9GENT
MDHLVLKGSDSEIDLESGSNRSEDYGGEYVDSSGGNSKKGLNGVWSELVGQESPDGSAKGGKSSYSIGKVLSSDEIFVKNEDRWPEKLGEEMSNFSEKKRAHKKPKMPNSKRPPKPPRPPGGPSLDLADMKLVKEISELAILKRKRTERMKTLQKMRKEKTPSMSSSLIALVVTALFFLVIIFQGTQRIVRN